MLKALVCLLILLFPLTATCDENDNNSRYHRNRGEKFKNGGDPRQAVREYTEAIRYTPKDASLYISRGTIYSDLQEYPKAIADLTKAIAIDPNQSSAWNNRGVAFLRSGQKKKATADFTEACHILNSNLACANLLELQEEGMSAFEFITTAQNYRSSNDSTNAIKYFEKALARTPTLYEPTLALGELYFQADGGEARTGHPNAVYYFQKAISLNPKDIRGYLGLAKIYHTDRKHDLAQQVHTKVIELDDSYGPSYYLRALDYRGSFTNESGIFIRKGYDENVFRADAAKACELGVLVACNDSHRDYAPPYPLTKNFLSMKEMKSQLKEHGFALEGKVHLFWRNGFRTYPSIQAAIDSAAYGDTIYVGKGTYNEVLKINGKRNLSIVGDNARLITHLDETIVKIISSEKVRFSGFQVLHELKEGSCSYNCFELHQAHDTLLSGNDINGSGFIGVYVHSGSHNVIANNRIHSCFYGIMSSDLGSYFSLLVKNNAIFNNKMKDLSSNDTFNNVRLEDNTFGLPASKEDTASEEAEEATTEEAATEEGATEEAATEEAATEEAATEEAATEEAATEETATEETATEETATEKAATEEAATEKAATEEATTEEATTEEATTEEATSEEATSAASAEAEETTAEKATPVEATEPSDPG